MEKYCLTFLLMHCERKFPEQLHLYNKCNNYNYVTNILMFVHIHDDLKIRM